MNSPAPFVAASPSGGNGVGGQSACRLRLRAKAALTSQPYQGWLAPGPSMRAWSVWGHRSTPRSPPLLRAAHEPGRSQSKESAGGRRGNGPRTRHLASSSSGRAGRNALAVEALWLGDALLA
uniref:Uncharacterized protein n=1 Tax=Myotis myotis TaxID=51298 RepID=A0A7J7YDM4_MYOMY|nr:hypothetical protein mMyoMyo1_010977 [Myotis myotis]